jgi:hypothetical protein
MPVCFKPFCFNAVCQFSPLLNCRSLIFDLKSPFGWLCTWTLLGEYESHSTEQNGRLHGHCKLHQSPCACHLVQTTWLTYIYLSLTQPLI